MLRRWLTGLALLAVFLVPATVRSQEEGKQEENKKDQAPTLVVRVQSFDTMVQNIKILAKAVDKQEVGEQLEALIKSQGGPKGLEGLDTKKPIGLYARMGGDLNSMAAVLMVPVSDEKAFLKFLENINYKAIRNKEGVYIIEQNHLPVEVGFRLANGYAYVTALNLDAIDKGSLIAPATIFANDATALVSGSLRVDQIPKALRDLAIQKMEEELAKEKKKSKPGETEMERKGREAGIDAMGEMMAEFLRGGKELSGSLNIDPKTRMITAQMLVNGKKNSQLYANIAQLAKTPSPFSGLNTKDAALNTSINLVLPEKLAQAVGQGFDEGFKKALQKENNPALRKQAESFLKALEPSFKSGEISGAISMKVSKDAKEGKATLVAGFKLKDGAKVEQTLKKLIDEALQKDQDKIKWNASKAGEVGIHRIDAQEGYDKNAQKVLGKTPIFFAIREDALFVAAGEGGEAALTQALTARPGRAPVMQLEAEVGQISLLSGKEHEKAAAQKVFGNGEKGILRLTIEGGEALRIRFEMSLSVLEFGVAVSNRTREVRLIQPPSQ